MASEEDISEECVQFMELHVTQSILDHMIDFLSTRSDEGMDSCPFPPSKNYTKFLIALENCRTTNYNKPIKEE